ncbi:HNH endonuclease signature motif containing protein [Rhodococcus daqingensis]|uniref:HNH endonuclease signature motif containing protein n=1 Tax=Rhodococcus daqingensis TaxID=2479363 RepID=A0ABW2S3Z2_9NOCA
MYNIRPIRDVLNAMTGPQYRQFTDEFNARTAITADAHILWTGPRNSKGYGIVRLAGQEVKAHRVAWALTYARDPHPELVLDHLCRVPSCVNVDHLEEVTNPENVLRGNGPTAINAAKLECDRRHLLAGENLYINSRGERICRICHRFRNRRYKARQRAARLAA